VAFSVCALARSALGGAAARLTPFQVRVRAIVRVRVRVRVRVTLTLTPFQYCELLRGVLIVVVSGMVLTVDMSQA